jgi:hypothetical protein
MLARHDCQQGFALRSRSSDVDDGLNLAAAFMDRTRPSDNRGPSQAVEPDIAEKAFVDLHGDGGTAIAVGWERIELARATIGAVTGCDFRAANHPVDVHHDLSFE